jgi:hypothetical protein
MTLGVNSQQDLWLFRCVLHWELLWITFTKQLLTDSICWIIKLCKVGRQLTISISTWSCNAKSISSAPLIRLKGSDSRHEDDFVAFLLPMISLISTGENIWGIQPLFSVAFIRGFYTFIFNYFECENTLEKRMSSCKLLSLVSGSYATQTEGFRKRDSN